MLTIDEESRLSDEIGATYEVMGQEASPTVISFMVSDLAGYAFEQITLALGRCRREGVKGKFVLSDITTRINSTDGRVSSNEAWSIVCQLKDESDSAAVTAEILEAYEIARECGSENAQRMAFRDAYDRIVNLNRSQSINCKWFLSSGTDPRKRAVASKKAVDSGRLKISNQGLNLIESDKGCLDKLMIEASKKSVNSEAAKSALSGLRDMFALKPAPASIPKTAEQKAAMAVLEDCRGKHAEI